VPVIESAAESNRDHLDHVATRTIDMLAGIVDPVVAIWGLAFKAETDDVRSSPAIELIERLRAKDISVSAHDPVATINDSALQSSDRIAACIDADLLVVATEWSEYGQTDLHEVAAAMRRPIIFDLRAVIDPSEAAEAGCTLVRLGRGSSA
jgi:UDPglucose 6-dehydrogenase